jgi:ABC-type dipeptide/oligopeptide/nickel transport system ATPase component
MDELLKVENLKTYFYTGEGIAKAADGVSFSVESGEIFGLVGESRSGKSMTLKSILRLVAPPGRIVDGHIYYRGEDVLAWQQTRGLSRQRDLHDLPGTHDRARSHAERRRADCRDAARALRYGLQGSAPAGA